MSNTWSTGVWGQNEWGDQGPIVFELTAPSAATSSVGSIVAAQEIPVPLTAPSNLTSSIGSITTTQLSIIDLTSPGQMTSELGDYDNAGTSDGWGRNG